MKEKKITKTDVKKLEEQKKRQYTYMAKHTKEHYKRVEFRLRIETEQDIIDFLLKQGNVNLYIKQLIVEDMKKGNI